jgi:hypothetical protein
LSSEGEAVKLDTRRIFISHAHGDKPLADLLREALVLGGVSNDHFFYSSDRATGVPAGQGVEHHLKERLLEAGLVIELISPTFLTRPMCLMELGAAWALGAPTFPIVVPPLTHSDVTSKIGNVHLHHLGESSLDEVLEDLHDRIGDDVGIHTRSTQWNSAARKFKKELPAALEKCRANPQVATSQDNAHTSDTTIHGDEFTSSNYTVSTSEYDTEVFGEIQNRTAKRREYVSLTCTFYDSKRKILGTADGIVQRILPKETKTFKLTSNNPIDKFANFKIQIDSWD